MARKDPKPHELAQQLRMWADRLDQHGGLVAERAEMLSARGFSSSTMGSLPGRSTTSQDPDADVELTSTESAALRRDQFTEIDERWQRLLRTAWPLVTGGILLMDQVMASADPASADRKVRRSGSGICSACGRDVPGSPNDRLRSGWCDPCRQAWVYAKRPDRMAFERTRYAEKNPPTRVLADDARPE